MERGRLICLDGPDACGKTTLANKIGELVGPTQYSYIHLTYEKDNREMWRQNYLALWKAKCMMERGYTVVIDRVWISENIYSRVFRGGSKLAHDVRGFDRVIRRLRGTYVICCPSIESAVARHTKSYSEREEMYEPDERIALIAAGYLHMFFGHPMPGYNVPEYEDYAMHYMRRGFNRRMDVLRYDIDRQGHQLDSYAQLVLSTNDVWSNIPTLPPHRSNLVGDPYGAKFVMVGDRINVHKTGRWPLVDYGASSRTISAALHNLNVDERDLCWTNGNDATDPWLYQLWRDYPTLKFVALGREAELACRRLQIPYRGVYHPSYVGRFNKHEEYAKQLRDALELQP